MTNRGVERQIDVVVVIDELPSELGSERRERQKDEERKEEGLPGTFLTGPGADRGLPRTIPLSSSRCQASILSSESQLAQEIAQARSAPVE